jgi:uncharacterized protein (DUF1330 family)
MRAIPPIDRWRPGLTALPLTPRATSSSRDGRSRTAIPNGFCTGVGARRRRAARRPIWGRGPKTGTPEFFREHLHAHESYFASYGDSFIFRGPIRSADGAHNIGTALLLELPNRAAADRFWNEEPFARNGGYQRDARITRWVFGD